MPSSYWLSNSRQILKELRLISTFSEPEAESLDMVEVIMALGDIYEIEFPENDMEYYPTLESRVDYLYKYRQEVRK